MNYINEAFKKLETLNEEEFSLTKDGVNELKKFKDGDDLDVITVIDPDAEHEDDVQDSYVGKVILDCEVCHSKLYKDLTDVNVDEELGLANKDDECPYCYSTEGFKVIGQVADFNPTEEVKVSKEGDDTDVTVDGEKVVDEMLRRESNSERRKRIKRSLDKVYGEIKSAKSKSEKDELIDRQKRLEEDAFSGDHIENSTIAESFENVSIDTGAEVINITTEPKDPNASAEGIVPVEDDIAAQIMDPEASTEDSAPEDNAPAADEETVDLDADELVEESWNYLGESYLKNVYGNVDSYKATAVKSVDNKMIVEGVIKFTSGKEKQTSFIFESHSATKSGKVKFIGENAQITRGKKAFSMIGSINDKKLMVESLNYNYRAKDSDGRSRRIYGTVKKSK